MNPWTLIPWWIKYPAIAIYLIAKAPGWLGEKYDQRWELNAAPHREARNAKYKELETSVVKLTVEMHEFRKEHREDMKEVREYIIMKGK